MCDTPYPHEYLTHISRSVQLVLISFFCGRGPINMGGLWLSKTQPEHNRRPRSAKWSLAHAWVHPDSYCWPKGPAKDCKTQNSASAKGLFHNLSSGITKGLYCSAGPMGQLKVYICPFGPAKYFQQPMVAQNSFLGNGHNNFNYLSSIYHSVFHFASRLIW